MIFVPLPRRVGPTAKPLFSHWRTWHLQKLRRDSVVHVREGFGPAVSMPVPAYPCAPTAESGDDRSETVDTSQAVRGTEPRCPAPTVPRSARHAYRATDGLGHLLDEPERSTGSIISHCSSVSSQRPRIGQYGGLQSISRMPCSCLRSVNEGGYPRALNTGGYAGLGEPLAD